MLEPIRFPTARSRSPRKVDTMVVTSSGAEVPMATIVRPTIASLTPSVLALATAPSTSSSARVTSQCRVDPDRQLGHAGPERHHGEADHHRVDPEPGGPAAYGH